MTEKKVIVTRIAGQIVTALCEEERIAELHFQSPQEKLQVGDIYIARVKKIVPNIGAAFVEVLPGTECYYSLSGNLAPVFTHKAGKKPLCIGDELLVQVEREAVKTKVPTVTSKLSFTGTYAVLTTGNTVCGVSGKIQGAVRDTWKAFLDTLKADMPESAVPYGIVIRTGAADTPAPEVLQEIEKLAGEADSICTAALTRTCFSCMKKSVPSYLEVLKRIPPESLDKIITGEADLFAQMKEFLQRSMPEAAGKLSCYEDSMLPLYKLYPVAHTIQEALKERVWLKSGAYLIIQPTEALTVIDVNSGKCVLKKNRPDQFLKINLEAAKEAARQIRLRNLSGIILIDFINMEQREQQEVLRAELSLLLKKDSVRTELVDITKLQLFEITRRKVRKPLHEAAAFLLHAKEEQGSWEKKK